MLTFAEYSSGIRHTTAGWPVDLVHTCSAIHARIASTFVKIYSICANSVNNITLIFSVVINDSRP